MKKLLIAILLIAATASAQVLPPDRKCIDQALFARSVRIAMLTGQQEEDINQRVNAVRQQMNASDQEWVLMKGLIHTVFTNPLLSSKSPDEVYDYALETCSNNISS